MRKDFFPTRDGAIVPWSKNFLQRLSDEVGHFGVSEEELQAYAALDQEFVAAFMANAKPGARSKSTAARKETARKALEAEARRLSRLLHGTAGITDQQKALLGLSVRSGGGDQSLIGPPATRPLMVVTSVIGRRVTLHISDGDSPRRARPRGVAGAVLYSWEGDGDPPSELHKWRMRGYATASNHTLQFDHTTPTGVPVYLLAHWLSTRLETGPWSPMIHTYLQAGAAPEFVQLGVRRRAA